MMRRDDLARALALVSALVSARDLVSALDLARDLARDLALVSARDLDRARALVSARARALATVLGASTNGAVAPAQPGRAVRGVVGLAVRLLPVAQRSRYRAEFGVELAELPRRQRCGYALRVLASAWELRSGLVEAARMPDGEPARRAER